jgi:hypothetical protein
MNSLVLNAMEIAEGETPWDELATVWSLADQLTVLSPLQFPSRRFGAALRQQIWESWFPVSRCHGATDCACSFLLLTPLADDATP